MATPFTTLYDNFIINSFKKILNKRFSSILALSGIDQPEAQRDFDV